ncbi:hypothetical protein BO221_04810 [Archangium sp. Cb G35]|uniref:hypothetical protein n=1 Tax=Archangium sp. Cb G35 TaxID=1920190 RepID=UPI000937C4C8|nr:hypothetical protein [Archangium sp. Cb G35]OJT27308.1 hypothetical protein BO221_04810 [Archangium sp. Cb G35]
MRGQLDLFFHAVHPEPVKVARVALVACGKTKRDTPVPAADRYMYSTPLAGQGIGEQLAWLKEALAEMDEGQS